VGVFVIILGLAVLVMAIVVLPGACLLTALRQEPMVVWGAGPTVTVLLVAVLTEVFGRIGVPWGPLTGIGSLSLIAVGALGMGLIRGGEPRSGVKTAAIGMWREGHRVLVLAAIPVLLQVCFITRAMGRPGALLQNHDVMFHLNLIELMRSTGWASSLGASAAISGGSFYPSVFHAVAVLLTGVTDVPTAFNATLVGVGICLTIVEVVVLVRAYDGRTMACLVAGAACASTMWTPFLLFFNGQTPTGLAIALLPGALAAMEKAFRTYGLRGRLVLVACLSLGAGCAHPGGGQVLIVLACVMAPTGRLIARSESGSAEIAKPALRSRVLVGAAGLLILALMMANAQLQRMAAFPREPRTLLQRVELALFLTPREGRAWDYAWFLLLAGLGLIALGRERSRRLLVLAWSVCAALIVLAQSAVAPLAILFIAVALVIATWRRDAGVLGPAAVLGGILALEEWAFLSGWSFGWLRLQLMAVPWGMLMAGYVLGTLRAGVGRLAFRRATAWVVLIATLVPLPVAWWATTDPRLAREEQQAVEVARSGQYATQAQVAAYLDSLDLPEGSVITDTTYSFPIVLASRRPRQFVITPDRDFREKLDDPITGRVRYALVTDPQRSPADAIAARFPGIHENGAGVANLERQWVDGCGVAWRLYAFATP